MSQFHQFKEMRYWQKKKKEWQKKTIYAALEMSATEFLSGCLLLLEPVASIVFRTLFPVILFHFPCFAHKVQYFLHVLHYSNVKKDNAPTNSRLLYLIHRVWTVQCIFETTPQNEILALSEWCREKKFQIMTIKKNYSA